MTTPTPLCTVLNGTNTKGGERVVGILQKRLLVSLYLDHGAFQEDSSEKYAAGTWLELKLQNVLVVENMPVPFHLSVKGARINLNFSLSHKPSWKSDFPPQYQRHVYWPSDNTTQGSRNVVHLAGNLEPGASQYIRDNLTGKPGTIRPSCQVCGKANASFRCSVCSGAHCCSKECQKSDWKSHKQVCKKQK